MKLDTLHVYFDHNLCKTCGGKCCKISPCNYAPDDFDPQYFVDDIYARMKDGFAMFHRWNGLKVTAPTVGARHGVDPKFKEYAPDDSRPCKLLTEKGCKFNDTKRPTGGKLLIPARGGYCYYDKANPNVKKIQWEGYGDVFDDVGKLLYLDAKKDHDEEAIRTLRSYFYLDI